MKLIISGTTGVGKSTTVNLLKQNFESEGKKVIVISELVVDSVFFSLYFDDLVEWGFIAQLEFLLQRFKQWVKIEKKYKKYNKNTIIIYDRHFLEDIVFSQLINVRQAIPTGLQNAYRVVYDELVEKIIKQEEFGKPDYFIMLKATFDTVQKRQIKHAYADLEDKFSRAYWQDLYYRYYGKKAYRDIFLKYSKNFVELSTDDLTPDEAVEKILKYLKKRTKY